MNALPPLDKLGLAKWLEGLASDIKQSVEIECARANAKKAVKQHRQRHAELIDVARAGLMSGQSAVAVTATLAGLGADGELVSNIIKKLAKEVTRYKRDRRIARLVGKGYTNAQIGELVGLHEKTVAKIAPKNWI